MSCSLNNYKKSWKLPIFLVLRLEMGFTLNLNTVAQKSFGFKQLQKFSRGFNIYFRFKL